MMRDQPEQTADLIRRFARQSAPCQQFPATDHPLPA